MTELEGWRISSGFLFGWGVMCFILLIRNSNEKWRNYWRSVEIQAELNSVRMELVNSGVHQSGDLAEQVKALHNTSKFWEDLYRKEKAKNEGGK